MDTIVKIEHLTDTEKNQILVTKFLEEIDASFPIPLSEKVDLAEYSKKQMTYGHVLVARDGEKFIGMLLGYANDIVGHVGYIGTLGVLSSYRSQGVGKMLLSNMIELARDADMKSLSLYTHKTNERALTFYQRNGFTIQPETKPIRPDDIHLVLEL